jgi:molybdopterin molybdotransferase
MISFDEAVELVRSVTQPLGTETVPLADAAGRVLARPVVARIDSPRGHASAMDGYAVRDADLAGFPASLQVIAESFAGAGWSGTVAPGTCARIFTGAPVPAGADRVIIQENVRRDGDLAIIDEPPGRARHIRLRGSDFMSGEELLSAGRLLDPRAVVAAAAADIAELQVYLRPRVHILSTGDELTEPGTAREQADTIPESVSFGAAALAEQWGGRCVGRTRLRDDLAAMKRAAEDAVESADVVVVTGGASVGDKDFAKAMFEPLDLELLFSKVAMKPGKPVWLGRARGKLLIGLPGNPSSALVTGRLFVAALLAGLTGRGIEQAVRWRKVFLTSNLDACGSRETFHRARLTDGKAEILSFQDSSAQKALAQADLLVRQLADSGGLQAGAEVDVLEF